jgi:hypothetical protein
MRAGFMADSGPDLAWTDEGSEGELGRGGLFLCTGRLVLGLRESLEGRNDGCVRFFAHGEFLSARATHRAAALPGAGRPRGSATHEEA